MPLNGKCMDEKDVLRLVKTLGESLPRFEDGRINYTTSKTAPVVTVFIGYGNKFLLLKRSHKVQNYKGM